MNNVITKKMYSEMKMQSDRLKDRLNSLLVSLKDGFPISNEYVSQLKSALVSYLDVYKSIPESSVNFHTVSAKGNTQADINKFIVSDNDIQEMLLRMAAGKIVDLNNFSSEKINILIKNGYSVAVSIPSNFRDKTFYTLTEKGRELLSSNKLKLKTDVESHLQLLPQYLIDLPEKWNNSAFCRAAVISDFLSKNGPNYLLFCDTDAPQFPVGISVDSAQCEYIVAGIFNTADTESEINFIRKLCTVVGHTTLLVSSEKDKDILVKEWNMVQKNYPQLQWHILEA